MHLASIFCVQPLVVFNPKNILSIVNGNYTDWSKWTSCSTTCGVGVRTRNRTCTSPMPQFRGKSCEEQGLGLPSEAEHCYLRQCGGLCDLQLEKLRGALSTYLFLPSL